MKTMTKTSGRKFGTASFYASALKIALPVMAHFWLKKEKRLVNPAEKKWMRKG
ncbi:MAG: hypothetical protein J5930_01050 [Treponema sp.]|nr:hypothetical protein [Treponema sp.]